MQVIPAVEFATYDIQPKTYQDIRQGGVAAQLVFDDGHTVEGLFRRRLLFGKKEEVDHRHSAIYAIVDPVSGVRYYGSSRDLNRRRNGHKTYLKREGHHSPALQKAFSENDGVMLMYLNYFVPTPQADRDTLYDLEQRFITMEQGSKLLANTAKDVRHHQTGRPISDYHRQRIIETNATRTVTAETRALMSSKAKGTKRRVGTTHSDETKRLLSERRLANQKPVSVGGVEYPSARHAYLALGMSKATMNKRLNSTDSEYANYQRLE